MSRLSSRLFEPQQSFRNIDDERGHLEDVVTKKRNQFLRVVLPPFFFPRVRYIRGDRVKSTPICRASASFDESAREFLRFPPWALLTCDGKKARPHCIVKLAHRKQSSHSSRKRTRRRKEARGARGGKKERRKRNRREEEKEEEKEEVSRHTECKTHRGRLVALYSHA